uniref:Uncharacterized protein n=1 Tax=Marseillevirus sp. TaxID=2809551 RepID=A0AA96EM96_9VIRU|nr:hypothetical protein MarDSR_263 [Marseillevirus sp.]
MFHFGEETLSLHFFKDLRILEKTHKIFFHCKIFLFKHKIFLKVLLFGL